MSWIKNWISLDDPHDPFSKLSFSDQGKLQAIWRLAAKLDNVVAYDEKFVCRAIGARRVPLGDYLAADWIQVGNRDELKRLANAEKRAANRAKAASKPLAVRKQKASLEVDVEKEKDLKAVKPLVEDHVANGPGLHKIESPGGVLAFRYPKEDVA